jgi:hypothetical protein
MKTLIRVQEGQDLRLGLGFMTVQILVHPYKDSDSITVIGHISFQRNLSGKNGGDWYAMKFNVDTDSVDELQKMTSLLKKIKNNPDYNWNSQPEEIFKMIGAVEYKIFNHDFVPVAKEGENFYNVRTSTGELYSKIVAPDEKAARKTMKKRGWDKYELELKGVVKF